MCVVQLKKQLPQQNLVLSSGVALAALLFAAPALAADITVSTPLVVQQSIADGDRLIIESGGSISTANDAVVDAVDGTTIEVINNGSITTTFPLSEGIDAGLSTLSVTNTGTIQGGGIGIVASTITNLINSGSITGVSAAGVSGAITNLENSGSISGDTFGIGSTTIERLFNTGSILANSTTSGWGVQMDTGSIENHGTISGFIGIEADRGTAGNSSIVNSGFIGSNQAVTGAAIDLQGTGSDTITLLAGSKIVGTIAWDGTNDTLNLGKGLDAVVTTTNAAATTNFTSNIGVQTGNVTAQVDTSAIAQIDDAIGDTMRAVNGTVQSRIDSAFVTGGNAASSNGHSVAMPAKPITSGHWASLWGTGSRQDGSDTIVETEQYAGGGVVGFDGVTEDGGLIGLFGGGAYGRINTEVPGGQEIKNRSYYGGLYNRIARDNYYLDAKLGVGVTRLSSDRIVANNLVAGGVEHATANYNAYYMVPEVALSSQMEMNGTTYIPSISAGYTGIRVTGYTEKGSQANLTMGEREMHLLNTRLQIAASRDMANPDGTVANLRPYIGVEGQAGFGDTDNGTAYLLGQKVAFDTGDEDNSARGFAGVSFTRSISGNLNTFGAFEVGYDTSRDVSGSARIGVSKSF